MFSRTFRGAMMALLLIGLNSSITFAVGVKPLRTELAISPGESARATISVINSEDRVVKVRPIIGMYSGNDAQGYPIEVDISESDPRHLSSWVTFDRQELTLKPMESREVSFTVRAPSNAEPGGHYGSLIYEPIVEDGGEPVKVNTRVASLLLITVKGDVRTDGAVKEFGVAENLTADHPFAFAVEFENKGTIHVKPVGTITIADGKGQQIKGVARYLDPETKKEVIADAIPVNIMGGNVLPNSTRIFVADWAENVANGTFTASLDFTYAGVKVPQQTATFTINDALEVKRFHLVQGDSSAGFALTLKNNGSAPVRLQGEIEVMNEFDFKVAEVQLAENVAAILPGEEKVVELPWLDKQIPNGSYTANLVGTYGFSGQQLTAKTSFSSDGDGVSVASVAMFSLLALIVGAASFGGYVFLSRERGTR